MNPLYFVTLLACRRYANSCHIKSAYKIANIPRQAYLCSYPPPLAGYSIVLPLPSRRFSHDLIGLRSTREALPPPRGFTTADLVGTGCSSWPFGQFIFACLPLMVLVKLIVTNGPQHMITKSKFLQPSCARADE